MKEYKVTGIRYQMDAHLTYDEQTEAAEQLVAGLKIGQPVTLVAEPDNPSDKKAVAVYNDYKRIGYITKEEAIEVRTLLDKDAQCDGVVTRKDNHVTFFISIPNAPEQTTVPDTLARVLPESPLGESVRMPFTKDENALQLIAKQLIKMEITKDNLSEALQLAERYVPLLKTSICNEDNLWRTNIETKMSHLYDQRHELGMNDEAESRLSVIKKKVRDAVADMHRLKEHWPERVFRDHLNRLRTDESVNHHLYDKYRDAFLDGKSFEEADKDTVSAEHERLCKWLKDALKLPRDLPKMAVKVNYLRLSRWELYDLYGVLLVIEKLEQLLPESKAQKVVDQLKPIFFGEEKRAQEFYESIQVMKPREITDRVNQLVREGTISDKSNHRDLWKILNDAGLYKPTESNWNQQVK